MNIPDIINKGGEWFAGLGTGKSGGTRIVCVSGHVEQARACSSCRWASRRATLIDDVCGGIPNGRAAQGRHPGRQLDAAARRHASSTSRCEFDALMTDARIKDVEVRPASPFDLGGGRKLKTMAGSGGVVVFDDSTDVVALCARIMQFYAHESCGQCTPCREGTGWLARVCRRLARGEGEPGDVELLANIANGIGGNTICALGDAAAWPMLGFLTKFRADFEAKLAQSAKARKARSAIRRASGQRERRRERRAPAPAPAIGDAGRLLDAGRAGWRSSRSSPSPAATRSRAVMSLVATFFGLAGDLRDAVGALPGRRCRCWSTRAPSWCSSSSWS